MTIPSLGLSQRDAEERGRSRKPSSTTYPNNPPLNPVGSLDGTTKQPFFLDELCTEGELFLRIVDTVRQRRSIRDGAEQLTYRKLSHLLARFEIVEGCKQEYCRTAASSRRPFHLGRWL